MPPKRTPTPRTPATPRLPALDAPGSTGAPGSGGLMGPPAPPSGPRLGAPLGPPRAVAPLTLAPGPSPVVATFGRGALPTQQRRPTAVDYRAADQAVQTVERGTPHLHPLEGRYADSLAQEVADGTGMRAFGNESQVDRPWRNGRILGRADGTKQIIQPKPPGFSDVGVHAQPTAPIVRIPPRSAEAQAELDAAALRAAGGPAPGAGGAGGAGGPAGGAPVGGSGA